MSSSDYDTKMKATLSPTRPRRYVERWTRRYWQTKKFYLHVRWPLITASFLWLIYACSPAGSSKEPDAKIANKTSGPVRVQMEESNFPKTPQAQVFLRISQADFVNDSLAEELRVGPTPDGFDARAEANQALDGSVFKTAPGFVFSVTPATDVRLTLSSRGRLQAVTRSANPKNRFAISLGEFSQVYPPSFRERYDLTISSVPGAPNTFTFTYSFTVIRDDQVAQFVSLSPGDTTDKMLFARDVSGFVLARASTAGKCDGCIIQVTSMQIRQTVKEFAELPALPILGRDRVTTPSRFSGVLTKFVDRNLTAQALGQETSNVLIRVNLPATATTVKPWCHESEGLNSRCVIGGSQTYFDAINAVPMVAASNLLGGTSGVLSYYVAGKITLSIKRDGVVVEQKTVDVYSPTASILTSPTLPAWALDHIRTATASGLPEFAMDE